MGAGHGRTTGAEDDYGLRDGVKYNSSRSSDLAELVSITDLFLERERGVWRGCRRRTGGVRTIDNNIQANDRRPGEPVCGLRAGWHSAKDTRMSQVRLSVVL